MDEYLKPTYFLDCDTEVVRDFAQKALRNAETGRQKAVNLFYAVRDEIRYDPYDIDLSRNGFRASTIIGKKYGYCVAKAVVLCAAARACRIPSRLGFADVKNHLTTERLKELMKTDVFFYHGYSELYIEGKWVKATPTFNLSLCRRFGVKALDFDGRSDALLHPFDSNGHKHMEYVKDHGSFADVPHELIVEMFRRHYPMYFDDHDPTAGDFEQEAEGEKRRKKTMSFFRKSIDEMQAYEPGEQPLPGARVIKLNTNENPYPPSPGAIEAMKGLEGEALRRYPDPMSTHAREAAARIYGVPVDYVMAANGSDEILAYIARVCLEPGRKMVYPVPTYLLYPVLGRMQDCECVEVPYSEDFGVPVAELVKAKGAVTIICSPNNPDGNTASIRDLEALANNISGLLVIDEAYCDFAAGNALELVKKFSNVIVLRTLSKGYSLAGLRLGFGIAHPDVLKGILKVKDSYNVSAMAIRIGAAALLDQDYLKKTVALVIGARTKLAGNLASLGFKVWPSQSNFLFVRPPGGNAEYVFRSLRERGILVRHFSKPGISDKLRIAVGTPEEMEALIANLKDILK